MDTEISRLTLDDYDEAIDLLNLTFSRAHGHHDFEKLLPKLYYRDPERIACNVGLKTDGRIRAIVGVFPLDWKVGESMLRIAGVSGVSCHPDHTGNGYMTALMKHCVRQIQTEKYPLSYLSGQRQRYQNFGYENCGTTAVLSMTRQNFKRAEKRERTFRFETIGEGDAERLELIKNLCENQHTACVYPAEQYRRILHSYNQHPYAVVDESGQDTGCLIAIPEDEDITEIVAASTDLEVAITRQWVESRDKAVSISIPSSRSELIRALGKFSERYELRRSGNWQIFDWVPVLDAVLKVRVHQGGMPDGSVTIEISGAQRLEIEVGDGHAACRVSDRQPDLECDAFTASRVLFGPLTASHVVELPGNAGLLDAWCPLPLAISFKDGV